MIGVVVLLVFLSAVANAVVEVLRHDWEAFRNRFRNANPNFWYVGFSWRNKWKFGDESFGPKFWGSTTVFVWLTDGYHLIRSIEKLLIMVAIVLPVPACGLVEYVRLFTFAVIAWSIGFNLTYHYYFKHPL